MSNVPEALGLIAGKGVYPRLLAESAKAQGVRRVVAVAFKKETDPAIAKAVDELYWIHLGQLGDLLNVLRNSGVDRAVMAGQITPTHLFRLRLDADMRALLRALPERNAHTIFGAVADRLKGIGVELLPASAFMEAHMPAAGVLGARQPSDSEGADIALGMTVAHATSHLDIGQTVVVKEGTVLAVEAFEGTDEAIRRAGRLGGPGAVVVKVAKRGHDMRFDIPVVGDRTLRSLKRVRAAVLAVEAGRAILLERERLVRIADAQDLCLIAVAPQQQDEGAHDD